MDLKAFNTPQEIIEGKYPVKNFWIIAVDIGFSSVKGLAPNKRFCFPSYVKKMNSSLMSIDEEDIYYRDKDGTYLIGTKAQDLVRADDTNDTDSSFDRNRYFTKEFVILARTAVAIGLMNNEERPNQGQLRPFVQTGLPAAYLKADAPKIKAAFSQPGTYEIKIGSGKWLQFENTLKSSDINVTSQPAGTLNSILFDDNGEPRKQARQIMEKNIIIADIGFGTFDPYGVVNREKVLEESINNLGMKRVLEVASEYIYKEFNMDIKIPQMRKCMKDGYFKIVDIQQMTSKKIPLDNYIERACKEVATQAATKLYEMAGYFQDYDILVVTGGTGAAWFDYFKEALAGMEDLEIIPGNDGNELPIYYANARGYYMSAYRRLRKAGN